MTIAEEFEQRLKKLEQNSYKQVETQEVEQYETKWYEKTNDWLNEKLQNFSYWISNFWGNARDFIVGIFRALKESQHFDFMINILMVLLMGVLSYYLPKLFIKHMPLISQDTALVIINAGLSAMIWTWAFILVDLRLYINEYIIFKFLKRNGNNIFDYQESFKNLEKWQQMQLSSQKYIAYLFLYAVIFYAVSQTPHMGI